MTRPTCPRMFEVEAARDGRLTGASLAGFERHLASCAACASEARGLDELAGRIAGEPPEPRDDLHRRRERNRLLAAFDRALLAPERHAYGARGRASPWRLAGAFLVGGVVASLVWRSHREPAQARAARPVRAVVQADSTSRWTDRVTGGREEIALEEGALSVRVLHAPHDTQDGLDAKRRLVVILPDGELEDTGTVFTVRVDDGRTASVSVEEGSVLLRVRGENAVALRAGEAWQAPPPVEPPPSAPCPASPPTQASARSPTASSRGAREVRRVASALEPGGASAEFGAATARLDSGDNLGAATAFAAFLARHPEDARAEDAAYLRVLALQRAGNTDATRAAALDYLRSYPNGFRRAEVEPLSY